MPEPSTKRWSETALPQLVLVRLREFVREPEAIFWTFLFPILMTAGLGIAFRSAPADMVYVSVLEAASDFESSTGAITGANTGARNGANATNIRATLEADPLIRVEALDDSAAVLALRTGKIALLVVPGPSGVEYRYDDTRPEGVAARRVVDDVLQRAAGRTDPVAVSETRVQEPGSRYIDFVVPGLLGMGLMGSGIWGIGFTIVDSRRKRLLKRLVATPMPKPAFLASFAISRVTMLGVEAGVLLVFGAVAFGVPLRGSYVTLGVICLLASLMFGVIGLLVAARPRTLEGASGLMNLTMVPMWVFSGVFFSAERFPDVIQPIVQALPLTAVNDALRANMLEGASFAQVAPELGIVVAWMIGAFVVAMKLFRWQ